jgi:hypothetical protein
MGDLPVAFTWVLSFIGAVSWLDSAHNIALILVNSLVNPCVTVGFSQ